jgi:hypothetical protein
MSNISWADNLVKIFADKINIRVTRCLRVKTETSGWYGYNACFTNNIISAAVRLAQYCAKYHSGTEAKQTVYTNKCNIFNFIFLLALSCEYFRPVNTSGYVCRNNRPYNIIKAGKLTPWSIRPHNHPVHH